LIAQLSVDVGRTLTALQEQLGVKLEPVRRAAEVLVIDTSNGPRRISDRASSRQSPRRIAGQSTTSFAGGGRDMIGRADDGEESVGPNREPADGDTRQPFSTAPVARPGSGS